MNWATILAEESRENSLLRLDELVRQHNVREIVARNALRRYEKRGLVEHSSNKVYINRLNQQFSPRDLVNVLRRSRIYPWNRRSSNVTLQARVQSYSRA